MDNCFQIGNYLLSRHIQLKKDNAKLAMVILEAWINKSESTGYILNLHLDRFYFSVFSVKELQIPLTALHKWLGGKKYFIHDYTLIIMLHICTRNIKFLWLCNNM